MAGEIREDVTIGVKGDSADYVKAMLAAKASTDELAKALKASSEATEKATKGLGSTEQQLGKFATKMGATLLSVEMLKKGFKWAMEGGEIKQIETAFNRLGADIGRFQAVTDGTIPKVKLMQLSLKGMQGDFKASRLEMEAVFKAADNLADKGIGNTVKNVEILTAGLQGNTKALKELGIDVKKGTTEWETLQRVMGAVKGIAADTSPEDAASQSIERFGAAASDAGAEIKKGLADVLAVATDNLYEFLAATEMIKTQTREQEIYRQAAEEVGTKYKFKANETAPGYFKAILGFGGGAALPDALDQTLQLDQQVDFERSKLDEIQKLYEEKLKYSTERQARLDALEQETLDRERLVHSFTGGVDLRRGATLKRGPGDGTYSIGETGSVAGELTWGTAYDAERASFRESLGTQFGDLASNVGASFRGGGTTTQEFLGQDSDDGRSERLKKQMEDFKEKLADSGTAIGATYQTTNTLVSTGIDAIIEGNGKWLQSFRKALGGQMKASALQNAARGVEYAAMAIAGIPNMWAASGKAFAAAAAYTAGAALLSGGGGGGGSSGGGGGGGGAGGAIGAVNATVGGGAANTIGSGASAFRPFMPTPSNNDRGITVNVNSYGTTPADMGKLIVKGIHRGELANRTGETGVLDV